jgi:hypothetical protein
MIDKMATIYEESNGIKIEHATRVKEKGKAYIKFWRPNGLESRGGCVVTIFKL